MRRTVRPVCDAGLLEKYYAETISIRSGTNGGSNPSGQPGLPGGHAAFDNRQLSMFTPAEDTAGEICPDAAGNLVDRQILANPEVFPAGGDAASPLRT